MEEAIIWFRKSRSNQQQLIDYENLDNDLVKFLKNTLNENKYPLLWIPSNELRNKQKIFGKAIFSAKYSAEWTYLHKTGVRTKMVILKVIYNSRNNCELLIKEALINLEDINGKYYSAFIHELTMHTRSDLCENIVRFLGVTK
ncbi:8744_t:CDS:2, partial [Scutellospora calospora]